MFIKFCTGHSYALSKYKYNKTKYTRQKLFKILPHIDKHFFPNKIKLSVFSITVSAEDKYKNKVSIITMTFFFSNLPFSVQKPISEAQIHYLLQFIEDGSYWAYSKLPNSLFLSFYCFFTHPIV